jgi:hypothetical protein
MSLRTNIALKVIAIILFSFEMIAPALISSLNSQSQNQETQISSSDHLANAIANFLCEETNGEEEDITFEFVEAPSLAFATGFRQISWIGPHEVTPSRPPLFTLFHTYII